LCDKWSMYEKGAYNDLIVIQANSKNNISDEEKKFLEKFEILDQKSLDK